MNINVAPDSFDFVSEVDDLCGIPTLQDPQQNEIFGPYTNRIAWAFLGYDARTRTWHKHQLRNCEPHEPVLAADPTWSEREQEEISSASVIGSMLHPPLLPNNAACGVEQEPFLYMGCKFAWLYVPKLRRWELAPLGKA